MTTLIDKAVMIAVAAPKSQRQAAKDQKEVNTAMANVDARREVLAATGIAPGGTMDVKIVARLAGEIGTEVKASESQVVRIFAALRDSKTYDNATINLKAAYTKAVETWNHVHKDEPGMLADTIKDMARFCGVVQFGFQSQTSFYMSNWENRNKLRSNIVNLWTEQRDHWEGPNDPDKVPSDWLDLASARYNVKDGHKLFRQHVKESKDAETLLTELKTKRGIKAANAAQRTAATIGATQADKMAKALDGDIMAVYARLGNTLIDAAQYLTKKEMMAALATCEDNVRKLMRLRAEDQAAKDKAKHTAPATPVAQPLPEVTAEPTSEVTSVANQS
jgi:hypothetical protein